MAVTAIYIYSDAIGGQIPKATQLKLHGGCKPVMKAERVPKSQCPWCGMRNTPSTSIGDVNTVICWMCSCDGAGLCPGEQSGLYVVRPESTVKGPLAHDLHVPTP